MMMGTITINVICM